MPPQTQDLSSTFTLIFVSALLASVLVKAWLATRQMRHVAQHRAAVPAAYANEISLDAHQKAADYTLAKARLGLIELGLGAAVLIGWTLLGGLQWLNNTLIDAMGVGMAQQIAFLLSLVAIGGLIELPMSLYSTFILEERFGFNKLSWKLWLLDAVKGTVLGLLLGVPLLWVILTLMAVSGAGWWLWAWGALMAFQLFVMWIAPTVILPLFNKFTPLEDGELKARANALMQRCGFSAKGFFVMDGSTRSAHSNAFFTGFGSAKRVVFYDTLIAQLNHGEMEAVLAHELGHFKHRHILKHMATGALTTLAGLALLGWLSTQLWFYNGLGTQPNLLGANDALALALFMLALPVFTYFTSPLAAHFSRNDEFEADAFASAHARASDLKTALLKLYRDNASTLTPDPLFVRWYYSHPPATERLARLQTQ